MSFNNFLIGVHKLAVVSCTKELNNGSMNPIVLQCKRIPFFCTGLELDHKEPVYESNIHLIDVIDVTILVDG